MQPKPSVDPTDDEDRRLRYRRDADDFLLGYAGTMAEALAIKGKIAACLATQLPLTLSAAKTLITHAHTSRARFLGDDSGTMHSQTKVDQRRQRTVSTKIGLYIPEDVWQNKRQRYVRHGKATHRVARMNESAYDIITRYQAAYRGLGAYDTLAPNLSSLRYRGYTRATALLKPLADKGKTTVAKTNKRLKSTTETRSGPRQCLQLTIPRAKGKKPLVATFGGLRLRKTHTAIKDPGLMPYIRRRSEIGERLLNDPCEVWESKEHIPMHHIRHLADLNRGKGREKPLWRNIMISRKRKSLPLCQRGHDDVHHNRPKYRRQGDERAGCCESCTSGSEGGWGKRPKGPRPHAYPTARPLSGACDQEVNERTYAAPHKVHEEVSKQETRHHFEPRDVRVSLPRRADESSAVRSSGDHVPTSASLNVEVDEGRPVRLNASEESSSNLVKATWPKRLTGHHQKGTWAGSPQAPGGDDLRTPTGVQTPTRPHHSLLHQQLGKPSALHVRGLPTARKGDGAEGRR